MQVDPEVSPPSRTHRMRKSGSATAGPIPTVAHASRTAESRKLPASTTSALAGPITEISPPAKTAPSIEAPRSTVEASPVARSRGTSARSTSLGISACLALSPGPRRAPAIATSSRKPGKDRCPAW